MSHKRLSRAESREQTRLRLLAAATASIAKKGLAATSVEDIAAKAGFTRGAFYSNFSSKSDLFVELLRRDHENMLENLQKLLDASFSEDLQKQFALLYARCYRDHSHYIIWAEARLHAMRDAAFRQCVNGLYVKKREMIACFFERFCKGINVQLPGSCADHALVLIALMDGILYFDATMPSELPSASAEVVLREIFMRMFFGSRLA
jgi:AcrR family transcriptional regulator